MVKGLLPPPGKLVGPSQPGRLPDQPSKSTIRSSLVNRLLKAGAEVYWLKQRRTRRTRNLGTGAIWVPGAVADPRRARKGRHGARRDGARGVEAPAGDALKLKPVRIGLYDQYGGSMPSGWTRWLFEQFEFPFDVVYPAALDAGNLTSRFDVLVFPDGAMPRAESAGRGRTVPQPKPEDIPEEYRNRLGRLTVDKTVPQLQKFAAAGGTIVTLGSSTRLAELFGLPVKNGLLEKMPDGTERPLPREKFYVPGSVLRVSLDNTQIRSRTACPLKRTCSLKTARCSASRPTRSERA